MDKSYRVIQFYSEQASFKRNNCCSTLPEVPNSLKCTAWATAGSKAARELVKEAGKALQQESADNSNEAWQYFVVQVIRSLCSIFSKFRHWFLLCAVSKKKKTNNKCLGVNPAMTRSSTLITAADNEAKSTEPGVKSNSGAVILCIYVSICIGKPPLWTDLP